MKLSNVVERAIDVVCLIASFAILYLLPDRINALFYLLFAVSAFLFCIGFFRLIATFDEPDSPEEAWLAGLVFVAGGAAVTVLNSILFSAHFLPLSDSMLIRCSAV